MLNFCIDTHKRILVVKDHGHFFINRFQLGHVHRVGVFEARGYVGDLAGIIGIAYGYGGQCGFPYLVGLFRSRFGCRVITGHALVDRSHRASAQSHTAGRGYIRIVPQDDGVCYCQLFFCVSRSEYDASVRSRQFPVIAEQNGIFRIAQLIVGADDGHMLNVFRRVCKAVKHVISAWRITRPCQFVAHTHYFGKQGVVRRVGSADGQYGSAAFFHHTAKYINHVGIITVIDCFL